jgi:hypothetical protein
VIQPFELFVTNDPFEQIYVKLDPQSTIDKPPVYILEQVDKEIYVTLDGLRELVKAVKQLEKTTVSWNKKNDAKKNSHN